MIGEADAHKLTDPEHNLSAPFGVPLVSPPADQVVQGGETWTGAGIELLVRDYAGTLPGGTSYLSASSVHPGSYSAGMCYFREGLAGVIFRTETMTFS